MKKVTTIVGLLAIASSAAADESALTLRQALQTAVASQPDLESATIDTQISQAQVSAANGIQDWSITANASLERQPFQVFGVDIQNTLRLGGSISKLLPTGGTVSVSGTGRYTDEPLGFDSKYQTGLTLRVDQPLLRGAGKKATNSQIEVAKRGEVIAQQTGYVVANSLVRNIVAAYWELSFAQKEVQVRQESVGLAQERLRVTDILVKAQKVAPMERLAQDQIVAMRKNELAQAQFRLRSRKLTLAGLIGATTNANIVTTETPPEHAFAGSTAALKTKAYDVSPLMVLAKAQKTRAIAERTAARLDNRDRLDLTLQGGPTGIANTLGEATKKMFSLDNYTIVAGLNYQTTLGRTSLAAGERIGDLATKKQSLEVEKIKQQIDIELEQAFSLAQLSESLKKNSETILKVAQRNIKAETIRFEQGKSTSFDVQQRQLEAQDAKLALARATVDLAIAKSRIDAVMGTLLTNYQISLASAAQ